LSKHIIDDMNSVREICPTHDRAMTWYGDWYCPECMKLEHQSEMQAEADYYGSIALCTGCTFFGDGWCDKYPKMPANFFGRKKKCKHFKEWKPHNFNVDGFDHLNDREWDELKNGKR